MANPLKQLAGQTMIYGLSTILARIINFLFVPIYTRLLTPESYGVVTEFMAYIAVLQVVLVMGLETGCFRFANKEGVNPDKVYSNAFVTVFAVSATFLALMLAFAGPISSALGYEGYGSCIRQDYDKPMGVATYKTTADMDERLKRLLPPVEELEKLL